MVDPELPDDALVVNGRTLRQFAGLWMLILGALSGWHLIHAHITRAWVFGVLAVGLGPLGLLKPEVMRPVFATLSAITRPIGLVVTRLVLGIAFYGLFTPVAFVFKLAGRDPLARTRHGATTYWIARSTSTDSRRYLRQV